MVRRLEEKKMNIEHPPCSRPVAAGRTFNIEW